MAEYVTLLGVESVTRAAASMGQAAHQIQQAAGSIDIALFRHQQWMDDWLIRFQQVLEDSHKEPESSPASAVPITPNEQAIQDFKGRDD